MVPTQCGMGWIVIWNYISLTLYFLFNKKYYHNRNTIGLILIDLAYSGLAVVRWCYIIKNYITKVYNIQINIIQFCVFYRRYLISIDKESYDFICHIIIL